MSFPHKNRGLRTAIMSPEERIAALEAECASREDTYPLRWESKTGRSGYSAACTNEWAPGICEKPRIKCADCSNKAFLAVSDDVVYQHLSGRRTLGVYPMRGGPIPISGRSSQASSA